MRRSNRGTDPGVGDKLSSRHAQKGVIGQVVEPEDLPFATYTRPIKDPETGKVIDTYTGCIKPDIIMNPHAFPSRMTQGQVIESMLGWLSALTGTVGDATPFQAGMTAEAISLQLREHGWTEDGAFEMRSGITGEMLKARVFMGPVYMMRLSRMASKKIHARALGPTTMLTRQPVGSRAKQGGNKQGNMELHNFYSYGVPNLLWERFVYSSNPYLATFCQQRGFLAEDAKAPPAHLAHLGDIGDIGTGERGPHCRVCKTGAHVVKVRIPFVTKQLWLYQASMGIAPRLKITTSEDIDFSGQPAPGVYTEGLTIYIGRQHFVEREGAQESSSVRAAPMGQMGPPPPKGEAHRRAAKVASLPGGAHLRGPDPLEEAMARKRSRKTHHERREAEDECAF